jgi:hypothetical protein
MHVMKCNLIKLLFWGKSINLESFKILRKNRVLQKRGVGEMYGAAAPFHFSTGGEAVLHQGRRAGEDGSKPRRRLWLVLGPEEGEEQLGSAGP